MAVVGDFTGRASRASGGEPARPRLVDADNVEQLAGLQPEIHLSSVPGSPAVRWRFTQLEDFHPDRIFPLLPDRWPDAGPVEPPHREASAPPREDPAGQGGDADAAESASFGLNLGSGGLLDSIVEEAEPLPLSDVGVNDLGDFVNQVVRPHLVSDPDPSEGEEQDRRMVMLRQVLSDPAFKSLESAWRSVFELVRWCTAASEIRIHLVDRTRSELEREAEADTGTRALSDVLGSASRGPSQSERWAALVVLQDFGGSAADVRVLENLGDVAQSLETICITATRGDHLPSEAWERFRHLPAATRLGIACPRFLLRLPYGSDLEPCYEVAFTEIVGPWSEDLLLWGSPAVIAAVHLARSMSPGGREGRLGDERVVDELPFHVVNDGVDSTVFGPLERGPDSHAHGRLADHGVMVFRTDGSPGRIRVGVLRMAAAR